MGGKNKPDNSQVVQQQQQQAAEEAAKEAARQQRLKTGLASIKTAFEGSPVMADQATPFDWSKFTPTSDPSGKNLPTGYTAVQTFKPATPGTPAADPYARTRAVADLNAKTNAVNSQVIQPTAQSGGTGGGVAWAVKDPQGNLHYQGDPFDVTTQVDTGQKTGGFDDAFYNKYKQSVLDYYMPQVDEQYKKATDQATYGLGRSGNLRSSAASTLVADLAKQNDINQAGVRNQADTAAGDLRSQVSTEEQKATSQLYATEDPEVAANQATAAVRDISLKQPNLSPLSALFNVATIGGANVYKGYQGQQNLNAFNNQVGGAATNRSHVVGSA